MITKAYLSYITSFLKEGKSYFLPHTWVVLKEALYLKIWPKTNVQLKYIETYYLDRADNKVVRLNLTGLEFLRLLHALRVILLQDLVILRKQFPLYPLQKDSLFSCEEYQRFTARVESLLANVVTPNKLIMRKYWPAYKAIAKLRYKAAILEIKGVQLYVYTILKRLSEIERLLALFAPIPIQIQ